MASSSSIRSATIRIAEFQVGKHAIKGPIRFEIVQDSLEQMFSEIIRSLSVVVVAQIIPPGLLVHEDIVRALFDFKLAIPSFKEFFLFESPFSSFKAKEMIDLTVSPEGTKVLWAFIDAFVSETASMDKIHHDKENLYWSKIGRHSSGSMKFVYLRQRPEETYKTPEKFPLPIEEMSDLQWLELAALATNLPSTQVARIYTQKFDLYDSRQTIQKQYDFRVDGNKAVIRVWQPEIDLTVNVGDSQFLLGFVVFPKNIELLRDFLLQRQRVVNSFDNDAADITLLFSTLSNYKVFVTSTGATTVRIEEKKDIDEVIANLFLRRDTLDTPKVVLSFNPYTIRDILRVSPDTPIDVRRSIRAKPLQVTFFVPNNTEYTFTINEGDVCPTTEKEFIDILCPTNEEIVLEDDIHSLQVRLEHSIEYQPFSSRISSTLFNGKDFGFVEIFVCTNNVQIGMTATFKSRENNIISQVTKAFDKPFHRELGFKKVTLKNLVLHLLESNSENVFNKESPDYCFVGNELIDLNTPLALLVTKPSLRVHNKIEIVVNNHCSSLEELYTFKSRLLFAENNIPTIAPQSSIVVDVLPFTSTFFPLDQIVANIKQVAQWFDESLKPDIDQNIVYSRYSDWRDIVKSALNSIVFHLQHFILTLDSNNVDKGLFVLACGVATELNFLTRIIEVKMKNNDFLTLTNSLPKSEPSRYDGRVLSTLILLTQSYKSFLFNAVKAGQPDPQPHSVWGIGATRSSFHWPYHSIDAPVSLFQTMETQITSFLLHYNGKFQRKVFNFWEAPLNSSDTLWATLKQLLGELESDNLKNVCHIRLITENKVYKPLVFLLSLTPPSKEDKIFAAWFEIVKQEACVSLNLFFDCRLEENPTTIIQEWSSLREVPELRYMNSVTSMARSFRKTDVVFGEALTASSVSLYQELSIPKLAWVVVNETKDRISPFVAILVHRLGTDSSNVGGTALGASLLFREVGKNRYSGVSVPTIPSRALLDITKMLKLMAMYQLDMSQYDLTTTEGINVFASMLVRIRQVFIISNLWPFAIAKKKDLKRNLQLSLKIYQDQGSLSLMIPELTLCSGIWKFNDFSPFPADNLWVKYGIWQYLLD